MVWPWKRISCTASTCAGLSGTAVTTWIEWATPSVRFSEKPICSGAVTLTGTSPDTATPSTASWKYGQSAPVNLAETSTTTL